MPARWHRGALVQRSPPRATSGGHQRTCRENRSIVTDKLKYQTLTARSSLALRVRRWAAPSPPSRDPEAPPRRPTPSLHLASPRRAAPQRVGTCARRGASEREHALEQRVVRQLAGRAQGLHVRVARGLLGARRAEQRPGGGDGEAAAGRPGATRERDVDLPAQARRCTGVCRGVRGARAIQDRAIAAADAAACGLYHALNYGRYAARLVAQREDLAGSAEQMARARLRGELKARRRGGSVRTAPLRRVHQRECLGGALRACLPGGSPCACGGVQPHHTGGLR